MSTVVQRTAGAAISSASFLLKLRESTGPLHRSLEELPLSQSLTDPGISREQYGRYLLALHPVIAKAEESLYPILSHLLPDLEHRKKRSLIESDLTYLQIPTNQAGLSNGSDLIHVSRVPHAIGIIYVLEGSTLGGRVIVKNIRSSLGYVKNNGASYFTGYGDQTGPMWKIFLETLTRYEYDSGQGDAIIEGATQAFHIIRKQISSAPEL